MATFHVEFFSKCLNRGVPLEVVIPLDAPPQLAGSQPEEYPCLFLLHGFSGCETDWLYGAPIRELALKHGMAVVMPAGENSFYLNDEVRGALYEDFICKELPAFVRRVFPVSAKREDTAIAGLSMGGYGAIHSGFAAPDTFGHIIALSSALITDEVASMTPGQDNHMAPYSYYEHTFGKPQAVQGSHADPKALAKQCKESGNLPGLYIACGTEDFLIEPNRDFHQYLAQIGVAHEFVEGPGVHDWAFWSEYIQKAMVWLAPRLGGKEGQAS